MTEHSRDEVALGRWEDEGGSVGPAPRDSDQRDGAAHRLPPGFEEQPLWGFHDDTGRFSYQLHLVYGPPRRDWRGRIARLDERRSYWEVTWPTAVRTAHRRLARRSMSYARARELRGAGLTFGRFSSMRYQLPELLQVGEDSLEVLPTTA